MTFAEAERWDIHVGGGGIRSSDRNCDVQATLKKTLGVDFTPYNILGACNLPFAYQTLQVEPRIGTKLPCNVILRELSDGGIEVSVFDPLASMQVIDSPEPMTVAGQVRDNR